MAGFLFPFVASAIAGEAARNIGSRVIGSVAGGLLTSVDREALYTGNRIGETIIPDIPSLIRQWWTGWINANDFSDLLKSQGIDWDDLHPLTARRPASWANLIELERPLWPAEQYRKWWWQKRITDKEFREAMGRHGFATAPVSFEASQNNTKNYDLFTYDWNYLELGLIIDLWRRGKYEREEARLAILGLGFHQDDAETLLDKYDQPPDLATAFQMTNRELVTPERLSEYLQMMGFRQPEEREKLAQMRFWLPSPPDLVTFAVREGWDEQVAARFGYDNERPPAFDFWMNRSGAGGAADFPPLPPGTPPRTTWAQLFWRSHWQMISPTQAYEMYHRLRPNRVARFGADFAGLQPFTLQDVKSVLKIQDYPDGVREPLAAINSTLLTRVDIQRMREMEVIDSQEVYEQFRDRGYTEQDAANLRDFTELQARARRGGKFINRSKALIEDAYISGYYSRQQAAVALYETSYIDPNEALKWREKTFLERTQIALGNSFVVLALDLLDTKFWSGLTKQAVSILRRIYVAGRLTEAELRGKLQLAGISQARADQLILLWNFERLGPRRDLTAKKIHELAKEQIINLPEAERRLRNLGYDAAAVAQLLAEISRDFLLNLAKAQQQQAKTVAQQQKAAQAALRAAAAERRRLQNELARFASPQQLVDFFARHYLEMPAMHGRLTGILDDAEKVLYWERKGIDERAKRDAT